MKIISSTPAGGSTLQPGYCGFITRERDFIGEGIEYFEHFESGMPFVHTFIVESSSLSSGECGIIEAHAGPGVHRARLGEYLGASRCQCFVRIPLGYTGKIGQAIVTTAAGHLGEGYGFPLIIADAVANTFLGHCLNKVALNIPDRFLCWALSSAHRKICSQLVAMGLQSQFYLRLRGCLRRPADTILPKELGNDRQIWDPIIYKIS